MSHRWYSLPPKWGGAPHSGEQNCASTLILGKAGGGGQGQELCLHIQTESRGWFFPTHWELLGSRVGSPPSFPPPGSSIQIHPSALLGFGDKSSCLLTNSILHKLSQRTRAKIKQEEILLFFCFHNFKTHTFFGLQGDASPGDMPGPWVEWQWEGAKICLLPKQLPLPTIMAHRAEAVPPTPTWLPGAARPRPS